MNDFQVQRAFNEPKQSYFLLGPRGVGKSTLVKLRHPDALYINLLMGKVRRQYQAEPDRLMDIVHAQKPGQVIIIDEIQKVPELLSQIHALIEEKQNWKFILTGSSARKLKQNNLDLLGGRALKKNLHPFMAYELQKEFNLEEVLKLGLLPLRYHSPEPEETLDAYISLYLDEEVKLEGMVRAIEPFARFLEALSFSHGSTLNLSNIARECGVKRSTAENWLIIVQDLLIVYTIPVFTRRAKRLLISQIKIYFFDVGVYRSLRPRSILDSQSEIDGCALEGLVAQHLRAWIDYTKEEHALYFWRTKAGVEVDFILFGEFGLWAIEVKNAATIHSKDLTGLKNFYEDYPEATLILVYRGSERMKKGNILCMPCQDFLMNIKAGYPLEL